jgi:hypothetical protein
MDIEDMYTEIMGRVRIGGHSTFKAGYYPSRSNLHKYTKTIQKVQNGTIEYTLTIDFADDSIEPVGLKTVHIDRIPSIQALVEAVDGLLSKRNYGLNPDGSIQRV